MTSSSKILSLVKRESFFDDSFFKDSWEDFDKAVQSILDKFDDTGLKVRRRGCILRGGAFGVAAGSGAGIAFWSFGKCRGSSCASSGQ